MPLTENDNTAGPLTENRSLRTALVVIVIVVVVARQALAQPGAGTRPLWLRGCPKSRKRLSGGGGAGARGYHEPRDR